MATVAPGLKSEDDDDGEGQVCRPGGCSRMGLCWITRFVRKGFSKPLETKEMPALLSHFSAKTQCARAFKEWDAWTAAFHNQGSTGPVSPPSIPALAWRLHKTKLVTGALIGVVQGILVSAAKPVCLNYLISALMDAAESRREGIEGDTDITHMATLLVIFACVSFGEGFCKVATTNWVAAEAGTEILQWVVPLVQRKTALRSGLTKPSKENAPGNGVEGTHDKSELHRQPSLSISSRVPDSSTMEYAAVATTFGENDGMLAFDDAIDEENKVPVEMEAIAITNEETKTDLQDSIIGQSEEMKIPNESALLGNDVLRIFEEMKWLSTFPSCAAALISGVVTLIVLLGVPAAIGLASLCICLACNRLFGHFGKKISKQDLKAGDDRLHVMREIIDSVLQLKFMCWEENYLGLISKMRNIECKWLLRYRLLLVTSVTIGRVAPILAACATFTFMGLSGYEMKPNVIFSAMATFNALRLPLISIPLNIVQYATWQVSFARLNFFLSLPEHSQLPPASPVPAQKEEDTAQVVLLDASFSWSSASHGGSGPRALKNINLRVEKGQCVCIVGSVGSGKSTLLASILGETCVVEGTAALATQEQSVPNSGGTGIGFVPQRAFVLSGTILENILMGRPKDEDKLQSAIKGAAFASDLALMPHGLSTEVGERGTTLSGGQKQRLAIARAVYGDPSLLIIDDALAAVDGKVAREIWESTLLRRKLAGLTSIVCLNQLHFLKDADRIVFLHNGRVQGQGSLKELLPNPAFASFSNFGSLHAGAHDFSFDDVDRSVKSTVLPATEEKNDPDLLDEDLETASLGGDGKQEDVLQHNKQLYTEEKAKKGSLSKRAFWYFLSAAGGIPYICGSVMIGGGTYFLQCLADLWLASWVSGGFTMKTQEFANGYVARSVGTACSIMAFSMWNAFNVNKAGRKIHHACIDKLLHAPSSWWESTPSGRITARFSGDLSMIDRSFAHIMDDLQQFSFLLVSLLCAIIYILPPMAIIIGLGMLIYGIAIVAVNRTQREAKRESNQALSPLMTTLAESASGREIIHAMGFADFFLSKQQKQLDRWTKHNHFASSVVNWGTQLTNVIAGFFSLFAVVWVFSDTASFPDVAQVSVALNYCFFLPYLLGIYSMMIMMGSSGMTSVERVTEYLVPGALPQEPVWTIAEDPLAGDWPKEGKISFKNCTMAYRPDLPPALKNVSVDIRGGEHIGVVGRTGAGKSSIIALLFRILDPQGGEIVIDGRVISSVGLHTLRNGLAIIPQTPLLLPGTLAHNLDPFSKSSERELKNCLEKVGMRGIRLETDVSDLSVGQHQLVALARLVLLDGEDRPKVVIMDEPTANIDSKTDQMVQSLIKEQFAGTTMITIAHRLHTVLTSDRILVMDQGMVAEFSDPHSLLQNPDSLLSKMVDTGDAAHAKSLRKLAKDSSTKKLL